MKKLFPRVFIVATCLSALFWTGCKQESPASNGEVNSYKAVTINDIDARGDEYSKPIAYEETNLASLTDEQFLQDALSALTNVIRTTYKTDDTTTPKTKTCVCGSLNGIISGMENLLNSSSTTVSTKSLSTGLFIHLNDEAVSFTDTENNTALGKINFDWLDLVAHGETAEFLTTLGHYVEVFGQNSPAATWDTSGFSSINGSVALSAHATAKMKETRVPSGEYTKIYPSSQAGLALRVLVDASNVKLDVTKTGVNVAGTISGSADASVMMDSVYLGTDSYNMPLSINLHVKGFSNVSLNAILDAYANVSQSGSKAATITGADVYNAFASAIWGKNSTGNISLTCTVYDKNNKAFKSVTWTDAELVTVIMLLFS